MNIAAIDLNLLVALDALLEERHVTRAAARIGLSQPAMSAALGRLRSLIGDPLLLRTAGGMVPTSRAEQLAPPLRQALGAIRAVLERPAPVAPERLRRTFTILTNDYLLWALIPHLLSRLRHSAPSVDVRVVASRSLRPWERLQRSEGDVAIDWFPEAGEPEKDIHLAVVMRDWHACVTRTRHPAVRRRLTLHQFVGMPHVFVSMYDDPAGMGIVDPALFKLGLRRRIALVVPHMLAVPAIVAESDLVATIPVRLARVASRTWPLSVWRPPLDLPVSVIRMAWHERTHHDGAGAWLREQVVETGRSVSDR